MRLVRERSERYFEVRAGLYREMLRRLQDKAPMNDELLEDQEEVERQSLLERARELIHAFYL